MELLAVDFETANSEPSSICAVGLCRQDGRAAKKLLVRPEPCDFDAFNTSLHGIGPDAVAYCPTFKEVWPLLEEEFRGKLLVAHNAQFDVRALTLALAENLIECPEMHWLCTLQVARLVWPGRESYALGEICEDLSIGLEHHEADSDAAAAMELLERAKDAKGAGSVESLLLSLGITHCRVVGGRATRLNEQAAAALRGKRLAFTGTLISMTRHEAAAVVEAAGARHTASISSRLDFLVVGAAGGAGGKLTKAQTLIDSGAKTRILTEAEFLDVLFPRGAALME